jgi:hypothetical protein
MKARSGPPLKADPEYFKAFAEVMKRLQDSLKSAVGRKPVVVCVAGGAALHLYTGSRVSKDVDATVLARFLPPDNLEVSYRDADGHARLLYFDTQYNDTYALLHENAYEDAISIKVPGVDAKRLDVRLLQPLDLAVSKLSRFEAHDQEDIRALAIAGLIDAKGLRARAEEALPAYVGETRRVRTSIALAEKLIANNAPSSPSSSASRD